MLEISKFGSYRIAFVHHIIKVNLASYRILPVHHIIKVTISRFH